MNWWRFSNVFVFVYILAALTIAAFIGLYQYGKSKRCKNIDNPDDSDPRKYFTKQKKREEDDYEEIYDDDFFEDQ